MREACVPLEQGGVEEGARHPVEVAFAVLDAPRSGPGAHTCRLALAHRRVPLGDPDGRRDHGADVCKSGYVFAARQRALSWSQATREPVSTGWGNEDQDKEGMWRVRGLTGVPGNAGHHAGASAQGRAQGTAPLSCVWRAWLSSHPRASVPNPD